MGTNFLKVNFYETRKYISTQLYQYNCYSFSGKFTETQLATMYMYTCTCIILEFTQRLVRLPLLHAYVPVLY